MIEMPPRQQLPAPRDRDFRIVIILIILGVLGAILWFSDPAHQWPGKSRVDWPPPATAKP